MEAAVRMITCVSKSVAAFVFLAWGARMAPAPLAGAPAKMDAASIVVVARATKPKWRKGEIPKIEITFENDSDHVVWMPEPIRFGPWIPEEEENIFQAWVIVGKPAGADMVYGCMNGTAVEQPVRYRPLEPGGRIVISRELRCYDFSAVGSYEVRVSYWDRGKVDPKMIPIEAASIMRTRLDAPPRRVVIE